MSRAVRPAGATGLLEIPGAKTLARIRHLWHVWSSAKARKGLGSIAGVRAGFTVFTLEFLLNQPWDITENWTVGSEINTDVGLDVEIHCQKFLLACRRTRSMELAWLRNRPPRQSSIDRNKINVSDSDCAATKRAI